MTRRRASWIGDIRRDLRHALRLLRHSPGFAAAAVLTLTLGIGGCTAIWSLLYGVLLRPLPYPEPDRIVAIREGPLSNAAGRPSLGITSSRVVERWRRDGSTLEQIAAYQPRSYTLSGAGDAERINAAAVSPALFPLLDVAPAAGRFFFNSEETTGFEHVVVLAHRFWRDHFGARADALGSAILLDGVAHEVVGVAPEGLAFPDLNVKLWTPLVLSPLDLAPDHRLILPAIARLGPGIARTAAEAEGNAILAGLHREWSASAGIEMTAPELRLVPIRDDTVAGVRAGLMLLMTAVACVLLLGCANLVNLLLARDAGRARELAIRRALGASSARLAQLCLAEIAILVAAGCAGGIGLAFALVKLLPAFAPADLPRLTDVRLDSAALCFAIGASIVSAALVGLAPAWSSSRPLGISGLLSSSAQVAAASSGSAAPRRGRNAIAAAEIAIAAALLSAAALLIQSLLGLLRVDLGYRPDGVLSATLFLPETSYVDRPRARAELDAILEELDRSAEVRAAGLVTMLPLTDGWGYYRFPIEGRPVETDPGEWVVARPQFVSGGYLEAMGLRLAAGRFIDRRDRADATPVAVVNQEFVRRYFASADPLAHRVMVGERSAAIVGVIGDVRQAGGRDDSYPEIYLPYQQSALVPERQSLVIRTTNDPRAFLRTLREIVRRVDPGLPLADIATMEDRLSTSVGQPRFYSRVLGLFAIAALSLAATGIYGVLGVEASRRRRELAIRRALGAGTREIVLMMMRRGLSLAAIGVTAGMIAAMAISRTFASLLFGISPSHPPTLSAVAAIVASVALLACYLPARRAARIDPAETLRCE